MAELDGFIGSFGNLWEDELVSYNGESTVVDLQNLPNISIMIECFSDAELTTRVPATIEFLASPDGENFTFCSRITEDLPGTSKDTSRAHVFYTVGTRFMRLRRNDSDTAGNIYVRATVNAKR